MINYPKTCPEIPETTYAYSGGSIKPYRILTTVGLELMKRLGLNGLEHFITHPALRHAVHANERSAANPLLSKVRDRKLTELLDMLD